METIHWKHSARKETYGTKGLWLLTYVFFAFIFLKVPEYRFQNVSVCLLSFKKILWKFNIPYPHNSWVIYPWILYFFLLKYAIVSVCLKTNVPFFENAHISKTKNCSNVKQLLPPIRSAEIVESVRKYMDGISQNLQSLSSY